MMMNADSSGRVGHRVGGEPRLAAVLMAMLALVAGVVGFLAGPGVALGAPAPQAGGQDKPVKVRSVVRHPRVAQGGEVLVAVEMDFGAKYHAWPAAEVALGATLADVIRTELSFVKDANDRLVVPAWATGPAQVQYPQTNVHTVPDPSGGATKLEAPLYDKKSVIFARIGVRADAPLGEQTGTLNLYYQACDDEACLMPETVEIPVRVTVVAEGTADLGAEAEPGLFAGLRAEPAPVVGNGASPGAGAAPAPSAPGATQAADQGGSKAMAVAGGGVTSLFGLNLAQNFFVLLLAAAVGGFVLNLTPCVLPVIPIKVMALTSHAQSKAHALALGLWMASGVVAFWTVIGLPMAVVSRSFDPSQFIFGYWPVTLGLGLVIAVLGLGIMGLFTLDLPQSVYAVEAKADTPLGSFLFGVLTAVLGLPCFGFVAGGLLAAAATMPSWAIMTIFVGLGAGMAAPYLVLSVYPQLLKFLPRTGPASDLVKQVMGILLLAAAAFFVAAGIQVLVDARPYITNSLPWWAVVFFILLACVWLIVRVLQVARTAAVKVAMPALAVGLTALAVAFASGETAKDRKHWEERRAAMAGAPVGEVPAGVWVDYTPELFTAVRASGRPVFLDFTASWCINCKALKAAVLDPDPLRSAFRQRGVVVMEVNCSSAGSEGSKLLKSLGRTGVPTWVVYGPKASEPVFVSISTPTPSTVLEALDRAGVPPTAVAGSQK